MKRLYSECPAWARAGLVLGDPWMLTAGLVSAAFLRLSRAMAANERLANVAVVVAPTALLAEHVILHLTGS